MYREWSLLPIPSYVNPWPRPWSWSLRSKIFALVLVPEGGPWPSMLGMTLYLTQVASDKTSLLHWCDGVCWQWQHVQAHDNGITYLLTILAVFLICISF